MVAHLEMARSLCYRLSSVCLLATGCHVCIVSNLQCHVKEPTRITSNSNTCLDQILSNIPNLISEVKVESPISTNDHCTVSVIVNFKIAVEKAYERHIWLYKKGDYQGFKNALSQENWDECFNQPSVDVASDMWTEKLLKIAYEFIPNKQIVVRPRDSPWFTSELRGMRRKLLRFYKSAKNTGNTNDWNKYKTLNREYHECLNTAENDYNKKRNESLSCNRNSKTWWKIVNEILGRGGNDSYPPMYDEANDRYAVDSKTKADMFNNYFLSHSKVDTSNAKLPNMDIPPDQILNSINVSECEVFDQLQCLDTNKACGHDRLSAKMLKEAGSTIVPSLCKLINKSLAQCKFPVGWKKANIIAIHKKDDKSTVSNYRPISLLTTLSKIMERIVFKHVYNFCHINKLITDHQSGFRPKDSTINQLAFLYHTFCQAIDNKKEMRIVFCDVSKAFDKVWHEGLLYKLSSIGICGHLLRWFQDYLSKRQQRVLVRGQTSDWGTIEAGVPQGSVLGLLLFLIYVNDMVKVVSCGVKLFADDTLMYITVVPSG